MNLLFFTICTLCSLCYGSKLIFPDQPKQTENIVVAEGADENTVNACSYDLLGAIKSYSGLCMVVEGNYDNALIGFANCVSGPNQQWMLPASDNTIRSVGKCLTSNNEPSLGSEVYIYECTGEDNQKWLRTVDGRIANFASGYCLDAYQSPRLTMYWCDGTATQNFVLPNV